MGRRTASTKGFVPTGRLLGSRIRQASESRGFAQSKLLTRWAETVGEDIAAMTRPVEVRFGRGGLGATLTLLTTGAHAPIIEMQKEQLRDKVNAIYGYNAISRIRVTQTAATGFEEGQVAFETRKRDTDAAPHTPTKEAVETVREVGDDDLRTALARLGTHIQMKAETRKPT